MGLPIELVLRNALQNLPRTGHLMLELRQNRLGPTHCIPLCAVRGKLQSNRHINAATGKQYHQCNQVFAVTGYLCRNICPPASLSLGCFLTCLPRTDRLLNHFSKSSTCLRQGRGATSCITFPESS